MPARSPRLAAALLGVLVGTTGCTQRGVVDPADEVPDPGASADAGTGGRGDAGRAGDDGGPGEDAGATPDAGTDGGADAGDAGEPVVVEVEDLEATPRTRFSDAGDDHGGRGWLAFDRGGYAEGVVGSSDGLATGSHRIAVRARARGGRARVRLHVDDWFTVLDVLPGDAWAPVEVPVSVPGDPVILRLVRLDGDLEVDRLTLFPGGPGAGSIPPCRVADVERDPRAGWADSYAADGQCYCASTFDHNVGELLVPTPAGPRTVRAVCAALGPGPGREGHPVYNDVQCGHGPANDAGDEDWCPGRTDQGRAGCCDRGPRWDLTDATL